MLEKNPFILVVDDERASREAVAAALRREPYEVLFASSGAAAIASIARNLPDTVLLDVMMPDLDGYEVCRQIRAEPRSAHLPVVLVTALDTKSDLLRGLDAGADEFLTKPVNGTELRARVRTMLRIKRQHDALRAALELREELATMIVHDIRSPLSAILAYVHMLKQRGLPDASRHDVDVLKQQAARIESFLDELLITAKLEQGAMIAAKQPFDLCELVLEVLPTHQVVAEARQIELALELRVPSLRVHADATLLRRVVDNLLSNALKFTRRGGHVRVEVDAASGTGMVAELRVSDDGRGIAAVDRERIFEKFQIVELRRRGVAQLGLGLAFCKLAVDAHQGALRLTDNTPHGSCFIVQLP